MFFCGLYFIRHIFAASHSAHSFHIGIVFLLRLPIDSVSDNLQGGESTHARPARHWRVQMRGSRTKSKLQDLARLQRAGCQFAFRDQNGLKNMFLP